MLFSFPYLICEGQEVLLPEKKNEENLSFAEVILLNINI